MLPDTPIVILWLVAYSVCFLNLSLFFYCYLLTKRPVVFAFFLVLANMTLVTAVVMIMVIIHFFDNSLAPFVLLNTLATYYLTIPYFIYVARQGQRPSLVRILGPCLAAVALFNILLSFNLGLVVILLSGLPFMVPLIPVHRGHKDRQSKPSTQPFWQRIEGVGLLSMAVAIAAGASYFSLHFTTLIDLPNFKAIFFAVFVIGYQLPGLLFCQHTIRTSAKKLPPPVAEGSTLALSKREAEVAQKLCEGLTYHEIAVALFVSLSTVKKHVYSIYQKNHIRNNRELLNRMLQSKNSSL